MTHPPEEAIKLDKEIVAEIEAYFEAQIQHVYGDRVYVLKTKDIGGGIWFTHYEDFISITIGQSMYPQVNCTVVTATCHNPNMQGILLATIKGSLRQLHTTYSSYQTNIQKILSKD